MQRNRFQEVKDTLFRLLLGAVVTIVFALPADAQVKSERAVLAIVNGDSVFTSDVDAIFSRMHSAMSAAAKSDFDYHKLLNKLVNDRLIVQEAKALGIDEDEYVTRFLYGRKQNWVRGIYVRDNFKPDTIVSESSLLEYFHANYHKVRVRTISVESKATADSLAQQNSPGRADGQFGEDVLGRHVSLCRRYSVDEVLEYG